MSTDAAVVYEQASSDLPNTQLVPYKHPSSNKESTKGSKSRTRARAIQDLERIQKLKLERDKNMKEVENKIRIASAKRKKKARDEIEKRKVELGVADKVVGVPTLALIFQDISAEQGYESLPRQKKTKLVTFFDLNETEEDRDTKPIAELIKRYNRLWKNLFSKYQNAGFAAKKINAITFDTILNSVPSLSISDVSKILRDHDMLPQLVNKEEVGTLVRLINMKLDSQLARADLQSLTFHGFQQFIIQLALNCFSRPPKDLTGHSTYELLQALIDTFYIAVKSKNASTLLYEEASGNPTIKDKELIQSLTEKLQTEPDYPLPEGFSKIKELRTCVSHQVPERTAKVLGEAHTVSLTVVDQLLNELFGFHVIETQVKVQERWKVKPTFARPSKIEDIVKNPDLNNVNPSNKVKLQPIENERLSSQAQSQRNLPAPLPKQFTSLINKQPKTRQPAFSVCAGILNQLINRAVTADDQESNFMSNNSGALSHKSLNVVKSSQQTSVERKPLTKIPKNKVEQINQLKLQNQVKEQKRTERDKKLKQDLERLKEEKKTKDEEDRVKKEEEEKEKKVQEKKKEAFRIAKLKEEREKLQKLKQERDEKKKAEQEEKERAEEEEAEIKMEERKEFFKKQKEELAEKFKKQSEQKQAISKKESENEQLEREIKKKLKENILKQSEEAKKKTKKEEEMAKEMNQFLERPDIKKVFDLNEKGLFKYFKYFCKQAKNEGMEVDINFRLENMHYKEFAKFGHQTKIVPTICSAEDLASTFRNIVKHFKDKTAKDIELKAGIDAFKSAHYIDFALFKRALIRFALIACQTDTAQDDLPLTLEEQAQIGDQVSKQMRAEYKQSNADEDEEAFQTWLIYQESEIEKRTEQKKKDLRQSKADLAKRRSVRASSVTKQSFVDFELNQVTSEQLQNLFKFMGISSNGDIDEKVLEDRAVIVDTQVARKNTLGRLNMKQQRLPEQLGVIKEGKSEDQTKPMIGKSPSKELDEDFQTDRERVEEAKQ